MYSPLFMNMLGVLEKNFSLTKGDILEVLTGALCTPTPRDEFAMNAMQGLLAGFYRDNSKFNLSELPEEAYKIADAMLAQRNKDV